jgi:prepilin signal peptidase PulO-like enzyme (type II secretory pathway)
MAAFVFLFLFGLAVGSFLNVLALRYDGGWHVGGRSRCPHCRHTLRWFELVPLASFAIQRGRCRSCGAKIGFHYPLVELVSAAIFVFVPLHFVVYPWLVPAGWYFISGLWILAFEILLLIAYIDLRLQIVPDELVVLLGAAALFEAIFAGAYLGPEQQSFFGAPAALFGAYLYGNVWLGHLVGALFGAVLFGLLVLGTRGKGMGIGDVTLSVPLGFLFGWPDILFLSAFAFVFGGLVGATLLLGKWKTMKSAVPFAPFLAAGAVFVLFFGATTFQWYFRIIGL